MTVCPSNLTKRKLNNDVFEKFMKTSANRKKRVKIALLHNLEVLILVKDMGLESCINLFFLTNIMDQKNQVHKQVHLFSEGLPPQVHTDVPKTV